jgi:CDGSH-type Zn-finger protein
MRLAKAHPQKIVVRKDGPYLVYGQVPLVHRTQVVSEYGEPLTWKTDFAYPIREVYALCRCGQSLTMPFCDGRHTKIGFDGTETADPGSTAARQRVYEGSRRLTVKIDQSLCMDAGFCGTRNAHIEELVRQTGDSTMRSLVIAMIERCPAGALTYSIEPGEPDIEPDLPRQVAVTTEITSQGPIDGPLWVMGGIPIERADKQPMETRNRVTLCSCGISKNKPLCDGCHRPPDPASENPQGRGST